MNQCFEVEIRLSTGRKHKTMIWAENYVAAQKLISKEYGLGRGIDGKIKIVQPKG